MATPSLPSSKNDPVVGTVINGKFHVHRAIARGGMGRIYYGTQAPLDRPVALKIVKADSINEDESQFLKRFLLEASILAKLQHPNVVTLFDYGRIEGAKVEMFFIAMEYLDGQTLSERLRDQGALATFEALIFFRQIARGLREAHSRGVIHRDLKPSNIMLMPEADGGEIVKLVDFGIGKVGDGDEHAIASGSHDLSGEGLTREGVLVGTPKYMAPEQFDGRSSPASDVFALGTIMYQCLAGSLPFGGSTLAECMIAKLQHPIPPLRKVNPISDATENVERLVYAMLAKEPEARPTLDEVFGQLAVCEDEIFGGSGPRLGGVGGSGGLSASGSRPGLGFPISSSRASVGALRVPYTVIQAPSAIPSEGFTKMTPRPMASSAFPPSLSASGASKTNSGMMIGIGVAALFAFGTALAAGVWVAKGKLSASSGSTASASAAAASSSAPSSSPSFTLHLDSNPSGAAVLEDGKTLGATPLDLRIERSTVANGQTRSFQIKKDGFTATAFAQGASEVDVDTTLPLAPIGERTVKSSHVAGGKQPPTQQGKQPVNAGGGGSSDPDIRLKR